MPPADPLDLELPFQPPYDAAAMWRFLAGRAVPGLEEMAGPSYRRVLDLAHGPAVVGLTPREGHFHCTVELADPRDLDQAVARCRQLLHLDADPRALAAGLGSDPLLGPLVRAHPGLRVPGSVDPYETAIRAVIGQQVSVPAARTVAGRLVAGYGTPLPTPTGGLTHAFPTPQVLAGVDRLPMPAARTRTLTAVAAAVAAGTVPLRFGAEPAEATAALQAIPGIGPWTASYVALRGLGDPDAFPGTDLGIRYALVNLGVADHRPTIATLAERWRPIRSYAAQHLWTSLGSTGRDS
ncbi:MAG: DNA-3-methyladenine glycosylase [Sporichthyaceae bacterium]|nr:DNA-3-methyladenine glycosylase [Sporichthyaceae bacterium]